MKQHITKAQYNKLSEKAKDRLRKWCFKTYPEGFLSFPLDSNCTNPLLSIGEMIDFLGKYYEDVEISYVPQRGISKNIKSNISLWVKKTDDIINYYNLELCDSLWKAVKQKLEER